MSVGISELITQLRGDRSYQELSRDCGGDPSLGRLATIVNHGISAFPSVKTVLGLSKGLGVSPKDIVEACGVSLNLWDPSAPKPGFILPHGAEDLDTAQRAAVVTVIREFMRANEKAEK